MNIVIYIIQISLGMDYFVIEQQDKISTSNARCLTSLNISLFTSNKQ